MQVADKGQSGQELLTTQLIEADRAGLGVVDGWAIDAEEVFDTADGWAVEPDQALEPWESDEPTVAWQRGHDGSVKLGLIGHSAASPAQGPVAATNHRKHKSGGFLLSAEQIALYTWLVV